MSTSKKLTTLKKILHAGNGEPIEFILNTKAIYDYEVLVPPETDISTQKEEGQLIFPDDRCDLWY